MTVRVKISQNVDILAKVYLVHLTLLWLQGVKISQNVDIIAKVYLVEHCQKALRVVSTFTG